ncbi:MAG: hypothetical protein IJU62_06685 [Muribaculaceae bacterium]|nr:hypothetical protein [Muribaculaceae bacterium]
MGELIKLVGQGQVPGTGGRQSGMAALHTTLSLVAPVRAGAWARGMANGWRWGAGGPARGRAAWPTVGGGG